MSPAFAAFQLGAKNGNSYPKIEITLNRMDFKNSRVGTKTNMGVWKAGMPGSFEFTEGNSLQPFAVVSVYRIVVVVVSRVFLHTDDPLSIVRRVGEVTGHDEGACEVETIVVSSATDR